MKWLTIILCLKIKADFVHANEYINVLLHWYICLRHHFSEFSATLHNYSILVVFVSKQITHYIVFLANWSCEGINSLKEVTEWLAILPVTPQTVYFNTDLMQPLLQRKISSKYRASMPFAELSLGQLCIHSLILQEGGIAESLEHRPLQL